jgi:EAL domain-containing protein (putative c-di-GMP-specific phosphodiesterase class I)
MQAGNFRLLSCRDCQEGAGLDFDFTMAFQPFVDVLSGTIFGHEALVRGPNQEAAGMILSKVNDTNRYRFDQACRVKAIEWASRLDLQGVLSINFLPNAVYRPETCIRATLEAAQTMSFPTDRIMFEVTEGERVTDHAHLRGIFAEYKRHGFRTAIDDFGAGYAGLSLLAEFQPDFIKLDMALTRNIHKDRIRRSIVCGIIETCRELGLSVIAEGIESREECLALQDEGVRLFQGYLFAKPGFESLPAVPEEVLEQVKPRRTVDRRRMR